MTNQEVDIQDRKHTRERLKKEKPLVYNKLLNLDKKTSKKEKIPPVIELAYRYDCNLSCKHCFAARFEKKEKTLSPSDIRRLSQEATDMGVYQFILQGGEPLFWSDFDEVIEAINPKNFYMGLVTNATILDQEKIEHLRNIGIDKIVISLDSFDMIKYEDNRNCPGLYKRTINAMLQAKEAGIRIVINTLLTKQNVKSKELVDLIEFAKKHGFLIYVNFASPIGNWEGRYDLLLDQEDADYIYNLNLTHQVIKRDTYPYKGIKIGCSALRSIVYITQYGDVLPCPFIHISVGNLFEEPLADIIEKGMQIKWFRERPKLCLACEDMTFIKNKISKIYGKPSPVNMKEVFSKDEFSELIKHT